HCAGALPDRSAVNALDIASLALHSPFRHAYEKGFLTLNEQKKALPARIGIFGIGLEAYWPQFEGLKERLEGYQGEIEMNLASMGAEVISAGMVDTAQAGRAAGDLFAASN